MAETDSPFAGMDLVAIMRLPDATLAAYMLALCKQAIRAGFDTWPTTEEIREAETDAADRAGETDVPQRQQESRDLSAAALLTFRRQQGWTQTQMGVRLGVTGQTVSDLERGKARLTPRLEEEVRALLAGGGREEEPHG